MAVQLKPGVKVRPNGGSALSRYVGYISDTPSVIPGHARVHFPDLAVELTFGYDELEIAVEEGRPLTSYFTNDAEIAFNQAQQDPGDENDWAFARNDWAFAGEETEEVEDRYDNYTIEVGDDWVRETNEHDNGFVADVYADEDADPDSILSKMVSLDIKHVYNGNEDGNDSVGILITPSAAYELAEKLMDAADIAEAN